MFSRPRMSVATLGIVSTLFLTACGSVPQVLGVDVVASASLQ
ncbi:hypothetical protein FRC0316_00131 [Corynebacterium diphtheriae]|nr:hypothetical protein FRC0086_02343 [Corynebacterium diphtheriae]CAB0830341.1 hypothetical protein FRC0295_00111 [Corynebacterium diphtheriae]CAB0830459.1 hypothetical protein FRC0316_00131 [Corynebacterium diphtheriae]